MIWKPRPSVGASVFVAIASRENRSSGFLGGDFVAIRLAEWTGDIALVFSGLAGLLHWDWWFPVLFGTIAALTREASQGFLLTQQCGSGYLIRSITTTCLLCGVVASVAYMLSVI